MMDDFVKSKYSTKDKAKELRSAEEVPFQVDSGHTSFRENMQQDADLKKGESPIADKGGVKDATAPGALQNPGSKKQTGIEESEFGAGDSLPWEDAHRGGLDSHGHPVQKDAGAKVINVSEARRRKRSISGTRSTPSRGSIFEVSPRVKMIAVTVVVAIVLSMAVYFVQNNYAKLSNYSVNWSRDLSKGSFVGYVRFRGSLLKFSKDAAIYLDKEGKELWTVGYEMSNPFAMVNGDYAVIADKQKNKLMIFDKEGKVTDMNTINPISRFTISKFGVVATIEEDVASTYINFYNKEGKQLQVTVKSKMSGDGYPTDLSLSPDGKILMVGFAYIEKGKLKGRTVFYNFSDASLGVDNRVLAGFDNEFDDSLIGRVKFVSESSAFAVSNHGIHFFKINKLKPTLHRSYRFEERILSIAYTDKYIALITEGKNGSDAKNLLVYNPMGSSVFSKNITQNYKSFDIDGDYFFLNTDRDCTIFNQLGTEKFSGTLDFDISVISKSNEMNTFLVTGPSQMKSIQLK